MATKAIVGQKVGMTQVWDDDNRIVPVTVVRVQPCRVVQVKSPENDGYSALQVTFGQRDPGRVNSPQSGHYDKAGVSPGTKLVELRIDDVSSYQVGQELKVDCLAAGELVDVTSVSKGKGFAGVMKRHGFAGQRASHGAHKVHRKPGAVGMCATPSRVFRGKKMPGRMGHQKVTTLNLKVVEADPERDLLLVRGSVPGPKGATVVIRNAIKGPDVEPYDPAAVEAARAEAKAAEEAAAAEAKAAEEAAAAEAKAAEEAPAAEEAAAPAEEAAAPADEAEAPAEEAAAPAEEAEEAAAPAEEAAADEATDESGDEKDA